MGQNQMLMCGIYVDLNQIRAGEAATPEESPHTSAYLRIQQATTQRQERLFDTTSAKSAQWADTPWAAGFARPESGDRPPPGAWLAELSLQEGPEANAADGLKSATPYRCTDKGLLPLTLSQYLELLDWSGRHVVSGKSGSIPHHLVPILERLHVAPKNWLETISHFDRFFGRVVGRTESLARRATATGSNGFAACATAPPPSRERRPAGSYSPNRHDEVFGHLLAITFPASRSTGRCHFRFASRVSVNNP